MLGRGAPPTLDPATRYPSGARRPRAELCLLGLVAMLDPPRAEVAGRGRCVPPRGDPHHRRHRRPRPDRRRDRRGAWASLATRPTIVTGDELDAMSEAELDELLRERPRADLRAQLTGGQAAHRRRAARRAARRRDDRRRRQRRARAAPRRHRRRDGPLRHRRRPRGGDDGAHRRQLRHDRRRDRGRPPGLRQHPQVHPLHLRPRHPRGRAVPACSRSPAARSRCR